MKEQAKKTCCMAHGVAVACGPVLCREAQMRRLVAVLVVASFAGTSCYNTYHISQEQLLGLQTADKETVKVVETTKGKKLGIAPATRLFVRDLHGKRYPITPFNFKVTQSQLVASDRDYIFMLDQLKKEGEVDVLSNGLTAAAVIGAVAGATGVVILAWALASLATW
jgi:hypothetical protein